MVFEFRKTPFIRTSLSRKVGRVMKGDVSRVCFGIFLSFFFFVVDPALWKHQQFLGDLFTYFVLFGYFKYQQKYQLLNI